MESKSPSPEDLVEFKKIFNYFDPGETGRITSGALQILLQKFGHRPTIDDCNQMIRQISKDDFVLFEEFCALMLRRKAQEDPNIAAREAFLVELIVIIILLLLLILIIIIFWHC
jgi:Ca2+-binding EF-hand superfamily protein